MKGLYEDVRGLSEMQTRLGVSFLKKGCPDTHSQLL